MVFDGKKGSLSFVDRTSIGDVRGAMFHVVDVLTSVGFQRIGCAQAVRDDEPTLGIGAKGIGVRDEIGRVGRRKVNVLQRDFRHFSMMKCINSNAPT